MHPAIFGPRPPNGTPKQAFERLGFPTGLAPADLGAHERVVNIYRSEPARQILTGWCHRRLDGWGVEHTCDVLTSALVATHVVVAGQGEPTVVVLPGTNFNAATSTKLAGLLAAQQRTVVVDLPGQPGLSAAQRPKRERLHQYGAWVDELLPGRRGRGPLEGPHRYCQQAQGRAGDSALP